ncbi:hypothetical protein [Rhizosaccharibacter radicis]|uniref:Condensation domain-containing protein n=1 Tax=Rhizosaccharibacter radicis TaxID=2782605 RepID=A0ABT1W201_9PROT|nr:hypothetical protein [Acetobacteraceae bacterium KSS12]
MNQPTPQLAALPRALEPLEQLAWWFDQITPSHFVLVGEYEGRTTPEDWVQVLARLQAQHQLLAVSVLPDPPRFVPTARPIPLRLVPIADPACWQAEAAHEMHTRFDPFRGPLVRATVLHSELRATLILAAHHAVADGISIMHVFHNVLALLRIPPDAEVTAAFPDSAEPAERPSGPARAQTGSSRQRVLPDHPPILTALSLSADLADRLRRQAASEGTTVFGALAAALTLTVPARDGPDADSRPADASMRIIVPVNMRPMLGLSQEVRIMVGLTRVTAGTQAPHAFWPLARRLKADLVAQLEPDKLAAGAAELDAIAASTFSAEKADDFMRRHIAAEGMISNLGAVPFATQTADLRLAALWGPSILTGQAGEQVIGAASVDGVLYLLHTSYAPWPSLLENMKARLAEACR